MLFMIPTLILLALSACNAEGPDADIVKKIEEFMTSIKSSPLNIGERKAKFDEFLSSLGGTYKEDYDSLIAEMKSKIGEITDENVRSLGNQLIYMFEDGDLLTDEDFDIERVKTESLAAKLTDDKKKILRDIEAEMTPKLAKTLPNYKYARGILGRT